MKGSKKYRSYEYAHMRAELPQPMKDEIGKSTNVTDKRAGKVKTKSSKSERVRFTKPDIGNE
jgi:hypothetical protein